MGLGIAEEETLDEQGKGQLSYQESKVLCGEWFLLNVYDNMKSRMVTFEAYGLDTQHVLQLAFGYTDFDALFRFNPELMNPNRKEGRYHWVIERLEIATVGKERKLQRSAEVTEEVPELPVYETTRKIPTGRMDLKERQRLREKMDMLDIKRHDNITRKRQATKERFLKHIFALKAEDALRKKEVAEKIAKESAERWRLKLETEQKEEQERQRLEEKHKHRHRNVEVKEERTEEQEEEFLRSMRLRWKESDAMKAAALKTARERRAQEHAEQAQAARDRSLQLASCQDKREVNWKARDKRVAHNESQILARNMERKAEEERYKVAMREKNQEYIKECHRLRQPIYKAEIERIAERKAAADREAEKVREYEESRALEKKVNYKAQDYKEQKAELAATKSGGAGHAPGAKAKAKGRSKSKPIKKKPTDGAGDHKEAAEVPTGDEAGEAGEEGESAAQRTERVLDNVEGKMRAQMAEAKRREDLAAKREEKIQARDRERQEEANARAKKYREEKRQEDAELRKVAAQRRLALQERELDVLKAEERRKLEAEHLEKIRAKNIERKEALYLQTITAGGN